MSVTSPPRPPRPSTVVVDPDELQALVEALIEEARQRARRRRRRTAACILLAFVAGGALYFGLNRISRGAVHTSAAANAGAGATARRPAGRWEPAHGPPGGPAYAVAVAPSSTRVVYLATEGGVFRSTNGGATWTSAGLLRPRSPFAGSGVAGVTALVVDPRSPLTVYAATKTYAGLTPGGVPKYRETMYKTTDGGRAWHALGLRGQPLAFSPADPATLYATTGDPDEQGGLLRSANGGRSWRRADLGLPSGGLAGIAVDPSAPGTVYAAIGRGGVYETNDGGARWRTTGIPPQYGAATAVAIDPESPRTVYAGTSAGIVTSNDGGKSWRLLNTRIGSHGRDRGYMGVTELLVDPLHSRTLYASTACTGVFKSTNGGRSWRPADGGLEPRCGWSYSLALDPRSPRIVYAAAHTSGVLKSLDGGTHWQVSNAGVSVSSVSSLAVDPEDPRVVYAATRSFGAFKSDDRGADWQPLAPGHKIVAGLALDPSDSRNILLTATNGIVRSSDAGRSWTSAAFARRAVSVVAISGEKAYAGTTGDGLFASRDGGRTWHPLGLPGTYVQALAIAPGDAEVVYAGIFGSAARGLYRSSDGGGSWRRLTTGLDVDVTAIALDPHDPQTVYIGTTGGGEHSLFKSTDGGASWEPAHGGLRRRFEVTTVTGAVKSITDAVGVSALVIDPRHPTRLYAAGGNGVFTSSDAGASWQALDNGLTVRAVRTLALDARGGTLYAGTWGGGVVSLGVGS